MKLINTIIQIIESTNDLRLITNIIFDYNPIYKLNKYLNMFKHIQKVNE